MCVTCNVKRIFSTIIVVRQVVVDRTLSERLAQSRREKGVREWRDVRRAEIAEAAKVDPSMITLYEQGKSDPSEDVLSRLAPGRAYRSTSSWTA